MKLEEIKNFKSLPESYWLASADGDNYPKLEEERKIQTVIIGGGIAGITCGYLLAQAGVDTMILEAGRIAGNTTGHTTAKITSQHELIYHKIKNQMSQELAQQYADANETAIKEIKKVIDKLQIDCDYIPQSAFAYTQRDENIRDVMEEVSVASSLGIKAAYVDELPFPFPVKAAVRFDDQAQFHPLKYVFPLAEEYVKLGGKIHEHTRVVDIEEGENFILTTENGIKVTAEKVIIATHYPIYNKHGMYFTRIYQEKSYVIGIQAREKYPGGMYINVEEPARSFRSQPYNNGELILVGGDEHKCGQDGNTTKHYHALIDYANTYFTIENMPYRWSTQDCMTLDGLPYVGQFTSKTPNLYIITGFKKWGMTNSMASSMLIRDLIVKGDSPWKDVYNPSRQTMAASAINFVVENFNVAEKLIGGKIKSNPKDDVDIQPGEGKVIELYGKRAGAYRDEDGILYVVNTTCTHMGCELNWNDAERTWDCPCHGSRFTYEGKVIEGPAVKPLTMEEDVNTIGKLLTEDF
ncbi:FAD-dependent oxidoreductase [Sinanaerobacter chloroacetimidivorans]|jgi:glycine/D-amino acid oxidase-like deaminating enzyme/nitrite reductase/ring-hydroxylating ferredoxin subunit|uniref:FAD-dependent oxidoreductase n=1 Tax=Sinanaerobacter chloroacetimidivorans TaxID=2818044 RepID=A0A8J7W1K0_9FIRM|nr:FAD-dependent oxidoreductase [Sinanaerobacter chloroacetimidivorans]MBR0598731.1 FAD-dependent oxidoreductase [Sinanaerobacter chloroacetimidivorans]